MYMMSLASFVAVVVTIIVAILMRRSISWFRVVFLSGEISDQVANCALLNICLLVTWVAVLQACVDVIKGGSLSGLFCISAFYAGLALLLFKRLRCHQTIESA